MFVKMIHKFESPPFQRSADSDVIDNREMLDIFTKPNSAGMRANGDSKSLSQQQNCEHLINTTQSAAIDLTELHSTRLQELFEHHPIVTMLAGCDSNRRNRSRDCSMAQNVIGIGGFFDPKRFESS